MKKTLVILLVLVAVCVGAYLVYQGLSNNSEPAATGQPEVNTISQKENTAADTNVPVAAESPTTIIGKSVEGRDITAYHYGTGNTELLFVGGIHGGYEWNTALVAYQLMDYLTANPKVIPANLKVTVIPVLNPDGLNKVVKTSGAFLAKDVNASQAVQVSGRYNGNGVDLNRNFDCDWQTNAIWQNTKVSGGTAAFSEPESKAVQAYVGAHKPAAVVVWYSAIGGVFASNCHNGVLAETETLTKMYATASTYKAYESFDFYQTTGDMVNWLAKNGIPAISVLLTNHTDTEWAKNQAGIEAILKYYAR